MSRSRISGVEREANIGMLDRMSRAVTVWLLIIAAETINGSVRQIFLSPVIGDKNARKVSFAIALVLISAITILTIRWVGTVTFGQSVAVGSLWSLLTFCFETLMMYLFVGISSERLAADYDPRKGGMMTFGLLFLLVAPSLAFALRAKVTDDQLTS